MLLPIALMPDLARSLQGKDLGHIRIIARLWGIELRAPDARTALPGLVKAMLQPEQVQAMLAHLSEEERRALDDLSAERGRMPWTLFMRRYGEIREMGPGRRDREKPYQNDASPAEALWYRGLLARGFFDTPKGAVEQAYIPDDLKILLPTPHDKPDSLDVRPAASAERGHKLYANDRIIDHACTFLAALRLGVEEDRLDSMVRDWSKTLPVELTVRSITSLLEATGLVDSAGMPEPEAARLFLESSRAESLALIARSWLHSESFNELRQVPGISSEGEWQNDPPGTRQAILEMLPSPEERVWWSLNSFVSSVKAAAPDFQRPAGDYDSWHLRDRSTREFLRGVENWDRVEGELLRYVITGPLYWLGILDLAASQEGSAVSAFRFSRWASDLLEGSPPSGMESEVEPLLAFSDGRIQAPRLSPRAVRYQVSRFCEWLGEAPDRYFYRLSPASLQRAQDQGLRVDHLLALLRRHVKTLPPALVTALKRWDQTGAKARVDAVVVLRVSSPEVLQELRLSRVGRFLGDPLGPTAVIVQRTAVDRVVQALFAMGYLSDVHLEGE